MRTGDRWAVGAGGRELKVASDQTPVGMVFAAVWATWGTAVMAPPAPSWIQAVRRVDAHRQHLGVDLEQTGARLQAGSAEAST